MRIAYHASSAILSAYDLDAWLDASILTFPTVTGGVLISVKNPGYPFKLESDVAANDRTTLGGSKFSKILYTRSNAELAFDNVSDTDVALWRTFYSATKGFRYPFIVEQPVTLTLAVMMGGQDFPFKLDRWDSSSGTVKWAERI